MPTVAEQLREARQAMHLDIAQVAEATKLKADHIRSLEAGNYECFTAAIYLRGSLRTYANLLKLDSTALLAALDAERAGSKPGGASSTEEPRRSPSAVDGLMLRLSRLNWRKVAAVVVLIVIVVLANISYRAWKNRQAGDPLKTLTSEMYQATEPVTDLLPLPTNAPRRTP